MTSQNLSEKVTAFLRNLQKRDWAAARALCSDDATVWHSDGKGDSGIDDNIKSMADGMDGIESIEYTIVRQFSEGDDVLQQHVLDVTTSDGKHIQIRVAAYFSFTDGLISRIEEYGSAPAELADR
jgi:ketosteroid isomerase-like protein